MGFRAAVCLHFHFLFECPQYLIHRNVLQDRVQPLAPFTLRTLLHGSSESFECDNRIIFNAVQEEIINTKRFET